MRPALKVEEPASGIGHESCRAGGTRPPIFHQPRISAVNHDASLVAVVAHSHHLAVRAANESAVLRFRTCDGGDGDPLVQTLESGRDEVGGKANVAECRGLCQHCIAHKVAIDAELASLRQAAQQRICVGRVRVVVGPNEEALLQVDHFLHDGDVSGRERHNAARDHPTAGTSV